MKKMQIIEQISEITEEKTRIQNLVSEIKKDFEKRSNERKAFESQWRLNMNFVMGNQYCSITNSGDVEEFTKQYFWQEHEVFNHISTLIETRLSKLSRVRPQMTIIPASGDEGDIKTAKLSKKILNFATNSTSLSDLVSEATKWSEVCGTSFYKVCWNQNKGTTFISSDDKNVKSGDVDICVCSPFEIYPDSLSTENISDLSSLIHAKSYSADEVEKIWNKKVSGKEISVFSLGTANTLGGLGFSDTAKRITSCTKDNQVLVIERYSKPTIKYPHGRIEIVAGDELLFEGDLPFENGVEKAREFPFVKQSSIPQAGSFFGTCVVERVIPLQRAYNAVKNRKHEFLNRIAMGVLAVEDGSVDIDNLEDEGLSPGKILVYRQGSTPPQFMSAGKVPTDFVMEEERLLSEFLLVSGVSDLMRNSSVLAQSTSGVALNLLIEQDDTRLAITTDEIRRAIKNVGEMVLRLYKQLAILPRLAKVAGENGQIEVFYFSKSDISSDEIVFETENEINESLAQRRSMVLDLLKNGLLYDEDGKLSNKMRVKVLELLGFGVWENAQDINELHIKKASGENLKMLKQSEKVTPLEIDDHSLHISEHTAFMLGGEFQKAEKRDAKIVEQFLMHIRKHKQMQKLISEIEVKGEN